MPTVKDFGRFRIRVYYGDHNPPHFHIVGPDFAAQVAFSDLSVLNGDVPADVLREAREWAKENMAILQQTWDVGN